MRKYFNLRFEMLSQTFVGELKEGMIATTMQGVMNISAINENINEF